MIFLIECGGGLGNRINNIINGLFFIEKYKIDTFYLVWRNQNGLSCEFSEILNNDSDWNIIDEIVINNGLNLTDEKLKKIVKSEVDIKHLTNNVSEFTKAINKKRGTWIIRGSDNEYNIDENERLRLFKKHIYNKIFNQQWVLKKVNEFYKNNNIEKKKYIGLHIRRTDFPNMIKDEYIHNDIMKILENDKNIKIYLSSDSNETEKKFKKIYKNNIIIRNKKNVIMIKGNTSRIMHDNDITHILNKLGFMNTKKDENFLTYNVLRNKDSLKEAIIDIILLSQSKELIKSRGSYFKLVRDCFICNYYDI